MNDACRIVSEVLKALQPDRGNRYAPAGVRAAGKGAHRQWVLTCRYLATALPPDGRKGSKDRTEFLAACGIENEDEAL